MKILIVLILLILIVPVTPVQASCVSDCMAEYYGCRARAWQRYFNCISRGNEEFQCYMDFLVDLSDCDSEAVDCLEGCL